MVNRSRTAGSPSGPRPSAARPEARRSVKGRSRPGTRSPITVVAFDDRGIVVEIPVDPDGSFQTPPLPEGRFGLKVGHEAYEDPGLPAPLSVPSDTNRPPDPWASARAVTVEPGRDVDGVRLRFPD